MQGQNQSAPAQVAPIHTAGQILKLAPHPACTVRGIYYSLMLRTVGRNKPVHGRFRHNPDNSVGLSLPETPAGGGLIPAYELLINNKAVSSLIRDSQTQEIGSVVQTSSQEGMIDLDRSLADLVHRGEVTVEHAYEHAIDPKNFEHYL